MATADGSGVSVRRSNSVIAGSCNACRSHTNECGIEPHRVWCVQAQGAELRFCDDCVQVLRELLPVPEEED